MTQLCADHLEAGYELCGHGKSAEEVDERFDRLPSDVCNTADETRMRRVMELSLDFVCNDEFAHVSAEREFQIVGPMPGSDDSTKAPRRPSELPAYLASLYGVPLLTKEQEVHLFRKMNFLKYMAGKVREELDPSQPNLSLLEIERLHNGAVETRNNIIRANLRQVVSIAKRHVGPLHVLSELQSDGNTSLMQAVEKFDFARGNKFSSYASKAITMNFRRSIANGHRHRDRFRTGDEETIPRMTDERTGQWEQEQNQTKREATVKKLMSHLDGRELAIVVRRFGLDGDCKPSELTAIGADFHLSKERVRQIVLREIDKLCKVAQTEKIELPDGL